MLNDLGQLSLFIIQKMIEKKISFLTVLKLSSNSNCCFCSEITWMIPSTTATIKATEIIIRDTHVKTCEVLRLFCQSFTFSVSA